MEIDKGLVCLSFLCIVQVFIEGMRENTLDIFRILDLPQLEDELEPEIEKAPKKKRKSKKQKMAEEAAAKQRKFFTKFRLNIFVSN